MSRTAWKGMDLAQRIATLALAVLALIALVAMLSGCGSKDRASGGGQSGSQDRHSSSGRSHSGGVDDDAVGGSGSVQLSTLPKEARKTVQLIEDGGPFPYSRDGVVFGNYEHQLPKEPRGWYHEYTVKTPGASNRGTRRIIEGKDHTLYYTGNHYKSFQKVQQ